MFREIADGLYPDPRSFPHALQEVRESIGKMDNVIGAIICGSAAYGNVTERSDINIAVLCNAEARAEATRELKELREKLLGEFRIPLDLMVMSINDELSGYRIGAIDRALWHHLSYVVNNKGREAVIKQNPLYCFERNATSREDALYEYLSRKQRMLQKGPYRLDLNDSRTYDFLGKMFDVGIHVARRMLWLMNVDTGDDAKNGVVVSYKRHMEPHMEELPLLLEQLLAEDERYTRELKRQIALRDAGKLLEEKQYEAIIVSNVVRVTELASEFVRKNAQLIPQLVRQLVSVY